MLKNERQYKIMNILKHRHYATVEQLTKELFSSASSIRRDLTELELRGLVKRSYGRVEISDNHSALIPFAIRIDSDTTAKK